MRPGGRAWVTLWVGIAAWDVVAPPGELLTDSARRGVAAHPALTRGFIAVTALHLADLLPPQVDPYHYVGRFAGRLMVRICNS